MKIKSLLLSIIALCAAAASSHAATIVYNFTAASTQVTTQQSTAAAASNNFGSGITESVWTITGAAGGNRNTTVAINQSANADADAVAIGRAARALKATSHATHTFSVTIPSGVFVDFTSLQFTHGAFGADAGIANPTSFSFSVNNGGSCTPNTGSIATAVPTNGVHSAVYSIALSGLLNETGTTINFSILDNSNGNNSSLDNQFTYIDNVTLTGTVIPEPSAALLGSLGLLCLLRRRR